MLSITTYVTATLLATTMAFGYLSYRYNAQVAVLTSELKLSTDRLESAASAAKLLVSSCAITEALTEARQGLDIKTEDTFYTIKQGVEILENKIVKQVHKEHKDAVIVEESHTDSSNLAVIQRLLDDAYCLSAPSSAYCTSRQ